MKPVNEAAASSDAVSGVTLNDASWLNFVRRLSGIRSVGITRDPAGNLEQIRLLADGDREPRHLVREVVSLLSVWAGLDVPAEAFEVIQLSDDEKRPRARIVGYRETPCGPLVTAEVDLATGDRVTRGAASGPASSHLRPRIAAEAAADAMNRRLAGPGLCVVGSAEVVPLNSHRTVLVLAYLQGQPYTGSALIRGDEVGEAAVKATLDALNRQLAWPQQQG